MTGKVPIVRIDGEVVYDSTLILNRFDLEQADPALLSEDKEVAAKQRMLEEWSDESFYWYNQAIRWAPKNENRTIQQNSRFVPTIVRPFAKPLLRSLVGKQPKAQGLGRLPYDALLSEFDKRLADLEMFLGNEKFFFSGQPSAADFAISGIFSPGYLDGVTPDFQALVSRRKTLVNWYTRMEEISHHHTSQASGV
jgi:glutathione S-transferase